MALTFLHALLARLRPVSGGRMNTPAPHAAPSAKTTVPTAVPLPELMLAAHPLAAALLSGQHNRRRAGDGEEFWQFRPYQAHEPASAIDWRQSARSPNPETLWVREHEQKSPRSLLLWVDASPSMNWRSSPKMPTKREAALTMALALGEAALKAGERVGVAGTDQLYMGVQAFPRLAASLTQNHLSTPPLEATPPHAQLLLVGDFLWPEDTQQKIFQLCRQRPGRTAFLCVLDPAERDLPYHGQTRFNAPSQDVGSETSLTLPAVESLREDYKAEMTAHLHRLASQEGPRGCFALRWTDEAPLPALMKVFFWLGAKRPGEK